MTPIRSIVSLLCLLTLSAFANAQTQGPPMREGLVIVISVDQMKAEFHQWYGKHWTGGLKRLYDEGLVYSNAMLDYAASETGPGHATLMTGSFPRRHGILGNEWTDPTTRKNVYCVGDSTAGPVDSLGGGVSHRNLLSTTVGDWMKAATPATKVVSVSVKDRSAVLMGGKKPDQVYWYDRKSGSLVTSSVYATTAAAWVKEFNASQWAFTHVPPVWNKILPPDAYQGPDELAGEAVWAGTTVFPKFFNLAQRQEQMLTSPWGDAYILDAARAAISGEKLGTRGVTDLLAVGLSCTDYVGHSYGPNSHEMQDHLARLDIALGSFLADAEQAVGKGKVLVVLSADHACLPLPEYMLNVEHRFARRLDVGREVHPRMAALSDALRAEWGIVVPLIDKRGFLDYTASAAKGISREVLERRVREGLLKIDGIADVYFKSELSGATQPARGYADRFARSYYAPRGEDFQLRYCEGCLPTSRDTGTSHGSCYDYDNAVPVIVWGASTRPARVGRRVRTVDIAPTIAVRTGARLPDAIDGVPLTEALELVR